MVTGFLVKFFQNLKSAQQKEEDGKNLGTISLIKKQVKGPMCNLIMKQKGNKSIENDIWASRIPENFKQKSAKNTDTQKPANRKDLWNMFEQVATKDGSNLPVKLH